MSGKARHVDFYPDEYISGVAGHLRADEQGVYWMVCSLIMSEGAPVEYSDRRLAGLCRVRPADIRRIVNRLVEVKKLTLDGGKLSQKRAQSEVERASNRIQTASENGAKGGRPEKKHQQKQQTEKAGGFSAEKLTTNYQLPTIEDSHSESKDSSFETGAGAPLDARTYLFQNCLQNLVRQTGKRESQLRSLLGRWLKLTGDDAQAVGEAIDEALADRMADPVAWLEARFRARDGPPRPVRPNGEGWIVTKGTAEWKAWEQWYRKINDERSLWALRNAEKGQERPFRSRWPSPPE